MTSFLRCTSSCKMCSPLLTLCQPPWPSAEWAGIGPSWNLHPCGPQICLIRTLCALFKGNIDIIGSFSFNFFDSFTGRRLVLRQYICQPGWPQRNCERRFFIWGSWSDILKLPTTGPQGDLQTPLRLHESFYEWYSVHSSEGRGKEGEFCDVVSLRLTKCERTLL